MDKCPSCNQGTLKACTDGNNVVVGWFCPICGHDIYVNK